MYSDYRNKIIVTISHVKTKTNNVLSLNIFLLPCGTPRQAHLFLKQFLFCINQL